MRRFNTVTHIKIERHSQQFLQERTPKRRQKYKLQSKDNRK